MSRRRSKRSAGVVVMRCVDGTFRYLLLRAFNYWDFPKGGIEEGETPIEAARREVREETGIDELEFRWGEIHTETPPYGAGKVAVYYLAVTPSERVRLGMNPLLGRPEHHEYRWVSYDAALRLLGPRLQAVLAWSLGQTGPAC